MDVVVEEQVIELSLNEALDRLHAEGPDLIQARAQLDAARGIARQAAAGWQPILAAQGGYQRNDNEVIFDFGELFAGITQGLPVEITLPDITPVVIQPLDVWSGLASLQVPVLAPSAWATSSAAHRGVEAAEGSVAEAALQLELALVSAAAGADAADGVAEAARRAVAVAEAHLASTKIAQAAGTATIVDVLAAEADLARRKSDALQASASAAATRDQLGALLGVDGPARVTLPAEASPMPEAVARPAIAAAQAQVDSARARVAAARWRAFPTVSASATGLVQDEPFPTTKDTAYRLGVTATWTIYDGGFRYGQLDQARADREAAEAKLTAEELRVSRELRSAERDLAVAEQRLALATEQARLATTAADIAQKGLAAGTVTPLQARDAEQTAFQADIGVAAAEAQLTIARAGLRRARGLDQRW